MSLVDIKFYYDGKFYLSTNVVDCKLSYRKNLVYVKKAIDPDLISKIELENYLKEGVGFQNVRQLWYAKSGVPLHRGIKQIRGDGDVLEFCSFIGKDFMLEVYVIRGDDISPELLLAQDSVTSSSISKARPKTVSSSNHTHDIIPSDAPNLTPSYTFPSPSIQATTATQSKDLSIDPNPSILCSSEVVYEDAGSEDDDVCDEEDDLLGSESSDEDPDIVIDKNIFEDSDGDDGLFELNVDKEVHEENVPDENGQEHIDDVFDVFIDEDTYISSSGDEKLHKVRYPEFNHFVDFKRKICLKEKMTFASNEIFRKALKQYAIENGFDFYYLHNDKAKVSAYCMNKCKCDFKHNRKKCVCGKTECEFKATARRMGTDGSFQLKTWHPEHKCGWQGTNTKVTSVWLAHRYLEVYRLDPQWRIKQFILTVKREHMVEISYHQAWRARLRAMMMTNGYAPEQYARVWDYAATIMKYNPGSSCFVRPEQIIGHPEKPMFQRFYVCLQACKEGFKSGCRPIIGLDGCHLKGAYTGQVLSAVTLDGNDKIFPIAFAVVEAEKKSTWCWFLENLVKDIGLEALTFISDRQKGLLEAIKLVAPTADTRVCVRHLQNNFAKQWPGKAYKDSVMAAAKCATLPDFEEQMHNIKEMDEKAYAYLMRQEPCTWSLHGFRHYAKSDMLLNNACESFNSCILPAREMSILSMCEWIRRKLMKMFINKRAKMASHQGHLTPKAAEKLNQLRIESLYSCRCIGTGDVYEVDSRGKTYVADLVTRTCGCNMWDLTGLPCIHAICCIFKRRHSLEDYVSHYYTKETYMRAYMLNVNPMPGQDQWEKTPFPPLQPPRMVIQPGRPKKSRNKEPGEKASTKQTRLRTRKNSCGNCGEEGHTRKTCKNPSKESQGSTSNARTQPVNKGGRPIGTNTMPINPRKRKYTRKEVRPDPIPLHEEPALVARVAQATEVQGSQGGRAAQVQTGSTDDYDVDALILQELNQPSTQPTQTNTPVQQLRPATTKKYVPVGGGKNKRPTTRSMLKK